jgi:hypothetical protein
MQMEIRAAAIRGIDRLIDDLGGDGAALLSEFGVSPSDLDSEHGLLPTVTAGRILRSATKRRRVCWSGTCCRTPPASRGGSGR